MAWDEWEQLKAEAAERRSTGMQLNQLPPDGGSGGGGPNKTSYGDLKVGQDDLAAIGDRAFQLFDKLGKQGRVADASTGSAASDLKTQGFALGGALERVDQQWEKQLTSLIDACAHISNHMEFSGKVHQGDEYHVVGQVSSIATLDQGFDENPANPEGR
ncbi:hypothetical protein ACIQAC_08310 [Streptomyces sp. NPDC088387]|uniref:hypothetical protein n=1 Tax=Streptomyces sp. NPDC088387 TaxID=3365859 RepID=UPI00382D466A